MNHFTQKIVIALTFILSAATLAKATDSLPTTLESASVPTTDFHLTARPWSPLSIPASSYTARVLAECRYWITEDSGGVFSDPYQSGGEGSTFYAEYAKAVAMLLKAGTAGGGISTSDPLFASGVQAMTHVVDTGLTDGSQDFNLPPMMEALVMFQPFSGTTTLPTATYNAWVSALNGVVTPDNANNNWTTYYMKGEWLQYEFPLSNVTHADVTSGTYGVDSYWSNPEQSLMTNRWNLFSDWQSGDLGPVSLSTEVVGRSNELGLDYFGYNGSASTTMNPLVERGTYSSLLMQDPSGQNPCGGRTDDHCWVDSGIQACSEAMAEKLYARGGTTNVYQAGQFRHAAMLTFQNLYRWLRSDATYGGSFYTTKNQYNPSLRVGYQNASSYGYNANIFDLTTEAYDIRHSTITEEPAPTEIGGYAFETDSNPLLATAWSAAFANAGGTSMQIALRGDTTELNGNIWTALGVDRFGRPGWDTRLGPSDGAHSTSANLGVTFAPTWIEGGSFVRLASWPGIMSGTFTTSLATPVLTRCQVVWAPQSGKTGPTFQQNFTITPDGILCQTTQLSGTDVAGSWGVTCPLLADTDGTSATALTQSISSNIASVTGAPAATGFHTTDSQNFILINNNGDAMASETVQQSTYGDLNPVQATTSDTSGTTGTNTVFIYPATSSDPSAATVRGSGSSAFTVSGSGATAGYNAPGLNSSVTGNLYVGRTSAGGNGSAISVKTSNDVTFATTCNFILQLNGSGNVTSFEVDNSAAASTTTPANIQGHQYTSLTAYTPVTISGGSAPNPPTGLSATPGNNQVALTWSASTGATSYNVGRSTTSGSGYTTISSPTVTSYTDTSVTNGTTYYYVVTATNGYGTSGYSNQVSATPTSGSNLIANGTYNVVSDLSGLSVSAASTSNGAAVTQQTYTGAATEQWTVTNLGSNVLEMVVSGTSEALEVPGGSKTLSAATDISSYTGATYQQWTASSLSGFIQLTNVNSGLAANVNGGSLSPGATIIQWTLGNYTNEEWTFTSVSGGYLVQDGFNDDTRGGPTGSDPLDVAWYSMAVAGTTLSIVNDSGGIGDGYALQFAPTGGYMGTIANLPSVVTLVSGQSISYSFSFRFTGTSNLNAANNTRFGIFNSGGTRATADNAAETTFSDDVGYFTGTNAGLASGTGTQINRQPAGSNYIMMGTSYAELGTATGNSVNTGTTPHTATMTITRSGSTLVISSSIDGQTAATATDSSPLSYSFDEIGVAFGGTVPSPIIIDNVDVSVTSGSGTAFVTGQTLGPLRNNFSGWVGMEVTVGSTPITVKQVGRWVLSGNSGAHNVEVVQASNGAILGSASVNTSGATAGAFQYATLGTSIPLAASTSYYLLSSETSGGDQWYDVNGSTTSVTTTSAETVPNAEYSTNNTTFSPDGAADRCYVPVSFMY